MQKIIYNKYLGTVRGQSCLLVTGHENPVTIFFFNEMMCSSLAYSRQKSCNCQDAYVLQVFGE
jgi:hypothetical protein